MIVAYYTANFMTLMILFTLTALILVNRDVKIPATNLVVVSIFLMFAITVIGAFDVDTDVSGMTAAEVADIVRTRTLMSTLGYIMRPCVILTELLIILQSRKYRFLCVIPVVINAAVYSTALFGSRIAFYIDDSDIWNCGMLGMTIYVVQFIYLLLLLFCSIRSFSEGNRRKSIILVTVLIQAVLVAVMEINNETAYTNPITALCILEYYIYLSTVYRQKLNETLDAYIEQAEESGNRLKKLTKEVMEALANAIDAKDKYTNGHSLRVAEYSRKIAEAAGKSREECDKVYDAALLHDVGKIGVPIEILTKNGRLTDEEFEQIRQHPVMGAQILSNISETPWLSTGAHYHHERYDGKGYPDGLKGEDIPETARIIAVADAYDAMTSNRSYRDAIPQHIVREELVKGMGKQFDPGFAKIMIHMIDMDIEYRMKESVSGTNLQGAKGLRCDSIYHDCTEGVAITTQKTDIMLCSQPDEGFTLKESMPVLIVFDSLDGLVHPDGEDNKDVLYYEYAQIRLDGHVKEGHIRKSDVRYSDHPTNVDYLGAADTAQGQRYMVEAIRNRDHLMVRIYGGRQELQVILALPDTARYTYISLSGEHCEIHNIRIDNAHEKTAPIAIPRIVREISYIKDCPVGDLPNIEIDGPRKASTQGIAIKESMTLTFHTMSYPTARLVWHCPYFCIFTSPGGKVDEEGYREFFLLKMDGESWEAGEKVENSISTEQTKGFKDWDDWMEKNKQGLDCTVTVRRENNKIFMRTENLGIAVYSTTTILDDTKDVYLAVTGDQCAITNIRIYKGRT